MSLSKRNLWECYTRTFDSFSTTLEIKYEVVYITYPVLLMSLSPRHLTVRLKSVAESMGGGGIILLSKIILQKLSRNRRSIIGRRSLLHSDLVYIKVNRWRYEKYIFPSFLKQIVM